MLRAAMPRDLFGPDRPLTLLVNPAAGKGRARRRAAELASALRDAAVPLDVVESTRGGEATHLATAARGALLVVGGDGTVNEAVNGLAVRADASGPLAILPAGSGDDFASGAGFANDPPTLVRRLLAGTRRRVDLGEAIVDGQLTRRFANEVGIGFEADVVRAASRLRLRGQLLYVCATLRALAGLRPFEATLTMAGADAVTRSLSFASFCNGARVGGGLPFAPDAKLDDGRLDLLEVAATSRLGLLSLLRKLMRARHRGDPRVQVSPFEHAVLRCERAVAVAMDGELIHESARELHVRVLPGALTLCGVGAASELAS